MKSSGLKFDAAYQGVSGAFSEEAALVLCGPNARLRSCATLEAVFESLALGDARFGVVPATNSIAGPVPGCADLLAKYGATIERALALPIVHALIAPPNVRYTDIRRVASHPMALAQCARFLESHPELAPVAAFDTAGAVAQIVRERLTGTAAIASKRAAEVWGGVVLKDNIQDRDDNVTRFLLVRLESVNRARA